MAFEDKAIPTRIFTPGATTIRDRGGADITLNSNTIEINTLGDSSSILVTSPISIEYPSNNFTTYGEQTVESSFVVTQQTTQSGILPFEQTGSPILAAALSDYNPPTFTSQVNELPSIDPDFYYLFDENIVGVSQSIDYEGLNPDLNLEIIAGRSTNGTYPTAALKYNELTQQQKTNLNTIVSVLKQYNFSDLEIRAILSVSSKETAFLPVKEGDYSQTSSSRIKEIFKSLRKYTDAEINSLKKDPKLFFNKVYGNKYGNGPDDGYKYLGRGFNQITFKGNYTATQKLYEKYGSKGGKINIVNNPELLQTNTTIAAHMSAVYFLQAKNTYFKSKIFTTLEEAILYYIRGNAGWGTDINNAIVQEGLAKALAFSKTLPTTL